MSPGSRLPPTRRSRSSTTGCSCWCCSTRRSAASRGRPPRRWSRRCGAPGWSSACPGRTWRARWAGRPIRGAGACSISARRGRGQPRVAPPPTAPARPSAAILALDRDGRSSRWTRDGSRLPGADRVLRGLEGIVLLDGTWSQAKTLWWRNPWLLKLQRLVLNPPAPARLGRLRREPRPEALSTLEAAVAGAAPCRDGAGGGRCAARRARPADRGVRRTVRRRASADGSGPFPRRSPPAASRGAGVGIAVDLQPGDPQPGNAVPLDRPLPGEEFLDRQVVAPAASCRLIMPLRTAWTTTALRRTTQRLVSGGGSAGSGAVRSPAYCRVSQNDQSPERVSRSCAFMRAHLPRLLKKLLNRRCHDYSHDIGQIAHYVVRNN